MNVFRIFFLVSAALINKALSDVDSAGTDFVTIIPWNNNDVNTAPTVNLDFANTDATRTATVQLTYSVYAIVGEDVTTSLRYATVTVLPRSSSRKSFSADSVYQYVTHGLNTEYPSTKIYISSDIPISVFAHNYASDGAGDTFTVLPTSMAAKDYSFSLPATSSAKGLSMIYFLPTIADVNIKFSVLTASSTSPVEYTVLVPAGPTAKVVMFGGPPKDFTFYASGDNPFIIVSGVRLLPTLASSTVQDFGSFMPLPLTSANCTEYSVNDYHFTDLSSSNYFTMTSPGRTCNRFQVTALGPKTNFTDGIFINPGTVHTPIKFTADRYGELLILRSQTARVEMVRYGGYGLSAGPNQGQGAFLDNLPSRDQFVTGPTAYISYTATSQITVFGDDQTRQTASLDGQAIPPGQWQRQLYYGNVIYYALASVQNGTHFFSASGKYTIHLSASTNYRAQGYTPRVMWQGTAGPTAFPPGSTTSQLSTSPQPPLSTTVASTTQPPASASSTTTTAAPPVTSATQPATAPTTTGAATVKLSVGVLIAALSSAVYMR